ncbi:dioxygenase [Streptomyces sp. Ru73]|uniref:carotenoid oxygenase family protein n=1 Tax=Streptomyces sp. Ru73 TaxID=2080748 RepID=UPI000CDDB20E|nr:carotenoid oxygenase family protein [Streptomyces sp. Ru73]POX39288.1 dioxygenase [Streptomyces sp. Ru73]
MTDRTTARIPGTAGHEAQSAPTDTAARPLVLSGHLAPVPDEIDARDLPVSGALPPELRGRYLRNGPNPLPSSGAGAHWFLGHGMLHGIRIADGRAEWYRNRWVRTTRLAGAPAVRPDGTRDLTANSANTHVIEHGGRLLALCEGGLPYRMTPELGTLGPEDFGGRLHTAMTAHPKEDPATGELHFFGYAPTPPYLTYHRMSASGELEHSRVIDVPGPTMMHDFAITEHYAVWLDLPVTFDAALRGAGMPLRWNDAYGARLGVMALSGEGPVRWFDIEPCYVFHVGNAHEDAAGRLVLDAVRYDRATFNSMWTAIGGRAAAAPGAAAALPTGPGASGAASPAAPGPVLYRWTLDLVTGAVGETPLDDLAVEFPTLHAGRVGRDNRYLYLAAEQPSGAVVRYDVTTGERRVHDAGPDRAVGEAVFVPARDARAEDEGWLLTIVTDRSGAGSDLLVLDATDPAGAPVASVRLPRAVPAGFHGSWLPDDAEAEGGAGNGTGR